MDKRVIDVACGSKMFWFDKHNPDVEFCDNRTVPYHEYYPHRYIEISPDTVCDFTSLPFEDGHFKLVVFDPPHLIWAGDTSWTALKYGCLKGDWKEMLRKGFAECFRVLDPDGVLIFKWSEVQIPLRDILPFSPHPPLFGHRSGKNMNTHWLCFMKPIDDTGEVEGGKMRRYTVSKDKNSGLWYAHMIGFPYIPVFGSFSEKKHMAMQYAKMMNLEPHKLKDEDEDERFERWKEALDNEV